MPNTPSDANRNAQTPALLKEDYERLANFRYALRVFSRQTELAAREMGLTHQQYFLLLAIKGFPGREAANITELAERLQIRHNAVIGLVDRAEERGLVERDSQSDDRRVVLVRLTRQGAETLAAVASGLRAERHDVLLAMQALEAQGATHGLDGADGMNGADGVDGVDGANDRKDA